MASRVGEITPSDVEHVNDLIEGRIDVKVFLRIMVNNGHISPVQEIVVSEMSDRVGSYQMTTDDVRFSMRLNNGTIHRCKRAVVDLVMELGDVSEEHAYAILGLVRGRQHSRCKSLEADSGAESFTNIANWLRKQNCKYIIDGAYNLWPLDKLVGVMSLSDERVHQLSQKYVYAVFDESIVFVHDGLGDVREHPGNPFYSLTCTDSRRRWNAIPVVRQNNGWSQAHS